MRTMLGERHMPMFAALEVPEAHLVYSRLMAARALPPELCVAEPQSGEELFGLCQRAGLDHAGVVLTMARETSDIGMSAIAHLVGRPIAAWQRAVSERQAAAPPPVRRGVAAVQPRAEHSMVVVSHVPNPKKAGSAGWERYNLWQVGALVSECIAAGMWPADVRWDLSKGFVVLAAPSDPEAAAIRAAHLASRP